jgi:hypothetical protein
VASHRLKRHLNRYPLPERVLQQVYLNPYHEELMLQNRVQAQPLWSSECDEGLADSLPILLQ